MVGVFQMFVLTLCEAVNLVILTTNHSMLDIIMNFLAIVVITEFDDAFFFIVQGEELAVLLTDGEFEYEQKDTGETKMITSDEIFKIETTTSNFAKMRVPGNKLRKDPIAAEKALVDPTATNQEPPQTNQKNFIQAQPHFIHISSYDRTCGNKLARGYYKAVYIFNASLWFYFVPFYSIMMSFLIPMWSAQMKANLAAAAAEAEAS